MTLNDMTCHIENDTMSCHVMSCHVMSSHVMSCHVMSCHTDMTFTKFTSYMLNVLWIKMRVDGRINFMLDLVA